MLPWQPERPYFLQLRVTNKAETQTIIQSAPILLDGSAPSAGVIKDGPLFMEDTGLHGFQTYLKGSLASKTYLKNPIVFSELR